MWQNVGTDERRNPPGIVKASVILACQNDRLTLSTFAATFLVAIFWAGHIVPAWAMVIPGAVFGVVTVACMVIMYAWRSAVERMEEVDRSEA